MVLNLSGPDGKARLPGALTADAVAALLGLLYNPYEPLLHLSASNARVLLAALVIPAAHFFGTPSVLKLCDVGLAAESVSRSVRLNSTESSAAAATGAPTPRPT
jgi:hypothetical protein